MNVHPSFRDSVKGALSSRIVLRNLTFLALMAAALAAVPLRQVWASEIIAVWPCHFSTVSPAGSPTPRLASDFPSATPQSGIP